MNLKGRPPPRESMLCKQQSAIAQLTMTRGRTAWSGWVQLVRPCRGHLEARASRLKSPCPANLVAQSGCGHAFPRRKCYASNSKGSISSALPSRTKKTLLARCLATVTASVRKKPVHVSRDRTFTVSLARGSVSGSGSLLLGRQPHAWPLARYGPFLTRFQTRIIHRAHLQFDSWASRDSR